MTIPSLVEVIRSFHSTFMPDAMQCKLAMQLYDEMEKGQPDRGPLIPLDTPRSARVSLAIDPPGSEQQSLQA